MKKFPEPLKLNIGCGYDKRDGYVNIDINSETNPDIIIDLEKGKLPFPDDSVDEVLAFEVIEHIHNLEKLIEEIYRVMKTGAVLKLSVPYKDAQLGIPHVNRFDENYFQGWDREWYQSKTSPGRTLFRFNFKTQKLKLKGGRIALLLPFRTWRGFFSHMISGIYVELVKK